MLTKKEEARYRAIVRQIARMREQGWTPDTHPDFEPLEAELAALGTKMIPADYVSRALDRDAEGRCVYRYAQSGQTAAILTADACAYRLAIVATGQSYLFYSLNEVQHFVTHYYNEKEIADLDAFE